MEGFVTVGEVLAPHGVRGEVKVRPMTDFPERFGRLERIYVQRPEGTGREVRAVERARLHRGIVLLKLSGVDDRSAAETLRRALLQVTKAEVYPLPPGHYYVFQIEGLAVYDGTGRRLGVVREVLQTGANDVYVVAREDGRPDLLLPATREVIRKVDLEAGRMDVELLPGLE
ncbi:MAG: 16S rRNA processing protein RimM [Firmicutes bacterium]|nr:16S rRNA processing protein RimM [Bacillota bacterium]